MKTLALFLVIFLHQHLLYCQENLPLIYERSDSTDYIVFHITGDGGMRGFDVKLEEQFKLHHFSSIFLNSLHYFWNSRTPDQLAADMIPVIRESIKDWGKDKLILTGFSFGAEIIPFLYTRLPEDLKQKVRVIVMLTPAGTSDFTIHLTDMMGANHTYDYDVVKEVEMITSPKVLAVFGKEEESSFPASHKQANFDLVMIKGTHHFTDADRIMELILRELQ